MAEATQQPDPQAGIRQTMHDEIYGVARQKILKEIDDTKDDVRLGRVRDDKGEIKENPDFMEYIWAMIKSFIFALAQSFGLEKQLASMMGTPIPEGAEVDAVADKIALSASNTLTNDKFTFKDRNDFIGKLEQKIFADLQAGGDGYKSFSEEQLADAAHKAAISISQQPEFKKMFDANGNKLDTNHYASAVHIAAATEFSASFSQALADPKLAGQLKQLSGKEFGKQEITTVSHALSPVLVQYASPEDKKKLVDKGDDAAFTEVADKFRKELTGNIAGLNRGGRNWTPEGISVFADKLAEQYMLKEIKVAKTPDAFTQKMQKAEAAIAEKVARPILIKEVSEGIRTEVAIGTMNSYDKRSVFGTNQPLAYNSISDAIVALKEYHTPDAKFGYALRTDLNDLQKADAARLQDQVYNFAASDGWGAKNNAPTLAQRQTISEVVSDTVIKELSEPKNAELNREKMANHLQVKIKEALKANDGRIDKNAPAGHTMKAISEKHGDFYDRVAGDFTTNVKTKNGSWEQLSELRDSLQKHQKNTMEKAGGDYTKGVNPTIPGYQSPPTQGKGPVAQTPGISPF